MGKTLENEATQKKVHSFFSTVNKGTIMQASTMVGTSVSEQNAERISARLNKVSLEGMQKLIKFVRLAVVVGNAVVKIMGVVSEYRNFIVLWILWKWWKAANKSGEAGVPVPA